MFFQIIVLLIATGAAVGEAPQCILRMRSECPGDGLPKKSPSTPEEFRRDCETVTNLVRCAKNIFESCPGAEEDAQQAETILNLLKETCNESSEIYQVISSHISCAGPIFDNIRDLCVPISEEDETWRELFNEENAHLLSCGVHVQRIMCTATVVSKRCGAELRDIITDLSTKYDLHYAKDCTPDVFIQLEPYMRAYEKTLMEKDF